MKELLLEWMSFRGRGRVTDLPENLIGGESARKIVEALAVLGHVEPIGSNQWRIVPPCLAGLPEDRPVYRAALCGARTPGLLSRLKTVCAEHGAEVLESPTATGLDLVRVSSPRCSVVSTVAEAMGLAYQRSSAFTLLACIPAIRDWPRIPCPMVSGKVDTVLRFSRSRLHWVSSTLDEARESHSGFFRVRRDWDWVSIIKTGSDESATIDDRAGRLIVAAKLKVVSWDAEQRQFAIPIQLFPPRLIARALTMCTGTPPSYDEEDRIVWFTGVPVEVARLALAIIGLRIA